MCLCGTFPPQKPGWPYDLLCGEGWGCFPARCFQERLQQSQFILQSHWAHAGRPELQHQRQPPCQVKAGLGGGEQLPFPLRHKLGVWGSGPTSITS